MNLKSWFIYPLHKGGSILIIATWTLLFLSFFCVTLGSIVSAKLNVSKRLRDRTISYYVAKAGIEAGKQILRNDETGYDFYGDSWCNNEQFFKEVELGLGMFEVSYEQGGSKYYGLTDEERKLNLNFASGEMIAALLVNAGYSGLEAERLADCIVDWRDGNDEPLPLGAEDSYYNFLEKPYNCKDADFESIEELLLVKGMNEEIFSKIKEEITVCGTGAVNVNTAGKNVLVAIGMGGSLAEKIINYRLNLGEAPAADEDRVFEGQADIVEKISLTDEETEIVNFLIENDFITTSSDNFRVICNSELDKSNVSSEIRCIIDRDDKIKYWRQN